MGRRLHRMAAVAASLGVSVIACRAIVGIGDGPPTDVAQVDAAGPTQDAGRDAGRDAGPDGIVYAGAACETCLQAHCGLQAAACAADPPCSEVEGCLGACDGGNVSCRAGCIAANRIGADPADIALTACLAGSCAQQCGMTCGAFGANFGIDAAPGCQTCLLENGCAMGQECGSDPQCLGLAICQITNPFLDRQQACDQAFDGGVGAESALGNVVLGMCHEQCAAGRQWSCLGSSLPTPTGATTTLGLDLVDFFNPGTALGGATVAACSPLDPACSADSGALAMATSALDGNLTLTIPSGTTGYLAITESTLTPELFYWGYPLTEPTLGEGIPVLTTMDTQGAVQFAESIGIPVDLQTHAFIGLGVLDCMHVLAPAVRISISPEDPDGGTHVIYEQGGTFVATATETDSEGTAVIVNVPVTDQLKVTATPLAIGRPSSVLYVTTRAGTDTYVQLPVNQ